MLSLNLAATCAVFIYHSRKVRMRDDGYCLCLCACDLWSQLGSRWLPQLTHLRSLVPILLSSKLPNFLLQIQADPPPPAAPSIPCYSTPPSPKDIFQPLSLHQDNKRRKWTYSCAESKQQKWRKEIQPTPSLLKATIWFLLKESEFDTSFTMCKVCKMNIKHFGNTTHTQAYIINSEGKSILNRIVRW